ncbi:hypothetical protein [Ottowia sp.]|uniref:hypothetical protein n=1 Tax=Ottowia sp. TaxID=1898956 RepID=UPI0025DDAF39|nr:hypothetical protein [Ottowia sp.]MBK6745329.1 hypothetical protein [Ottowia sp.]
MPHADHPAKVVSLPLGGKRHLGGVDLDLDVAVQHLEVGGHRHAARNIHLVVPQRHHAPARIFK